MRIRCRAADGTVTEWPCDTWRKSTDGEINLIRDDEVFLTLGPDDYANEFTEIKTSARHDWLDALMPDRIH